MRIVEIGTQRYTKVLCLDDPGAGGACHEYTVIDANNTAPWQDKDNNFAKISFQNGAIKESGINGCQNEDLLAVVLDRLYGFQSGEFKCRENELAITKIEEALHWLNHRTQERIKRGVEGILVK